MANFRLSKAVTCSEVGLLTVPEIQNSLLDLMVELDRVCNHLGLRYSLDGGTLIGAVRHKGFIPWDDDMDVVMPRPDYERLIAHAAEFTGRFRLFSRQSECGYKYPFAKLCDKSIRAQEEAVRDIFDGYLWIDIFPVDGLPDTERDRIYEYKIVKRMLTKAVALYSNPASFAGVKGVVKKIYRMAKLPFVTPASGFDELDRFVRRIPFDSAEYVGHLANCYVSGIKPWYPRCCFDHLEKVEFEGHNFSALPNRDEYLKSIYGDYMVLPPVEKRIGHGIAAWRVAC